MASINSAKFLRNGQKLCNCGKSLALRTSWTNSNPGRRFWSCETYERAGGCGFFEWHDPEMCSHSIRVIPGLLRRLNQLEDEQSLLVKKLRRMQFFFIICLMLVLVLLLLLMVVRSGNCSKEKVLEVV